MNVSPHFAEHYQRFREWFISNYTGMDRQYIAYQDRQMRNPSLIDEERIMFDAWLRGYMTRDQQDKQKAQQEKHEVGKKPPPPPSPSTPPLPDPTRVTIEGLF
jgi:hypothetical protein